MVMEDGGVANFKLGSFFTHQACFNVLHEDQEYFQTWPIFLPKLYRYTAWEV